MVVKFWRSDKQHKVGTLVRSQRITSMTTSQLKEWIDVEIMNLGSMYDQWRFHGSGQEEVTDRLSALSTMWDEVTERTE